MKNIKFRSVIMTAFVMISAAVLPISAAESKPCKFCCTVTITCGVN